MRFRDIPPFTKTSSYSVDVGWAYIEQSLAGYADDARVMGQSFEMDPDFQRAHVWDQVRQIRYIEFVLRGGRSAKDIYWNCPGWQRTAPAGGRFVLVDGKQRLEAVRAFLRGDILAFGARFTEFTDRLPINAGFKFHVNDLETDAEVLQWYIDLNAGGVAHTDAEIERVRALLAAKTHS